MITSFPFELKQLVRYTKGMYMNPDCKECGKPMKSYYGLWCPTCETVDPEPAVVLNLLKVLHKFCAVHGYVEHKKEHDVIWAWLIEKNILIKNDTYSKCDFLEFTYDDEEGNAYRVNDRDYVYLYNYDAGDPELKPISEFIEYVVDTYMDTFKNHTVIWNTSW
jgi:hypothetical protein